MWVMCLQLAHAAPLSWQGPKTMVRLGPGVHFALGLKASIHSFKASVALKVASLSLPMASSITSLYLSVALLPRQMMYFLLPSSK